MTVGDDISCMIIYYIFDKSDAVYVSKNTTIITQVLCFVVHSPEMTRQPYPELRIP